MIRRVGSTGSVYESEAQAVLPHESCPVAVLIGFSNRRPAAAPVPCVLLYAPTYCDDP